MLNIGLNLYSLHTLLQDEKSLYQVCNRAKSIGYQNFQFSGMPFDAPMLKRISQQLDINFVLTHVPFDRIINDTFNLIAEHKSFGCQNIGLGILPMEILQGDEQKLLDTISQLNQVGKVMADNDAKFFYHFHHFEFVKLSNGKRIIDYFIENCPYVNFTADTYWIQYAGADICQYLGKMAGRIECIHLKDYQLCWQKDVGLTPKFAPIGVGNINFEPVIQKALQCGTKYFIVEQDDACQYENPFEQITTSYKALSAKF